MVGEDGDVLRTSQLHLQQESPHGGISAEGEHSSWWKTLLPQLNMVVEDMSWELFEEWFQDRYP
jgi:hypothetical protein